MQQAGFVFDPLGVALHAELAAVLGDRLPTLADLAAMPYAEQGIKESMRLSPPV